LRPFVCALVLLASAAVPCGAAGPRVAALTPPVDLADGTQALPLVGEAPEWYTERVFARAVEAAERGLAYDFASDRFTAAAAAPSQVLIRPGAQIFPESIFPGWCTGAFLFDGRTKIATAGHCTRGGDRVIALTAPTTVLVMGVTKNSTGAGSKIGADWALISIDPLWRPFTDPATALVGGPCGRTPKPLGPLKYVGHGAAVGTGGTARAGLFDSFGLVELLDDRPPGFTAVGPAYFGDSGAPVLESTRVEASGLCVAGGAVGLLTHVQVLVGVVPTGFFFGTSISRIGNRLDDADLLP
jgi:hypothetical protein